MINTFPFRPAAPRFRLLMSIICAVSILFLMVAMAFLFRETANLGSARAVAQENMRIVNEALNASKSVKLARLQWMLDPTPARLAELALQKGQLLDLLSRSAVANAPGGPSHNMTEALRLFQLVEPAVEGLSSADIRRSYFGGVLAQRSDQVIEVLKQERARLQDQIATRRARELNNQTLILQASLVLGTLVVAQAAQMTLRFRHEKAAAMRETYLEKLAQERDRADILARELSHRVKNLFAVIASIVTMTARGETDAQLAAQKACARINALAVAHNLATQNDISESRGPYTVSDLLNRVVEPFCSNDGTLIIKGSNVMLKPAMVTPLGLIANELATNALKYGAWSTPSGTVTIDINCFPQSAMISVLWAETGGPVPHEPCENTGFGTTMIDLSVRQIGGVLDRVWLREGLQLRISFKGVT